MGYNKSSVQGLSWYDFVHWEHLREAQSKHRLSKTQNHENGAENRVYSYNCHFSYTIRTGEVLYTTIAAPDQCQYMDMGSRRASGEGQ